MTTVRLAYGGNTEILAKALGAPETAVPQPPAVLVSYYYLDMFVKQRHRYRIRNWSMDSGAYSAFKSGATIDRSRYHETCRHLLATDPQLVEVFALDVIGDWRASLRNAEAAWEEGVPAIPVYHAGEPEAALLEMARTYPKIAISTGGRFLGTARRVAYAQQVMARIWPKPVHGLGFSSIKELIAVPFHSCDATSWEMGPLAFGNWRTYGKLSVRGVYHNLVGEVLAHLEVERKLRVRWRREMELLDAQLEEWRSLAPACPAAEAAP